MTVRTADVAAVALSALFALTLYLVRSRRRAVPLPPGPTKWPIVGSAFSVPKTREWETYDRWTREYDSDVIYYTSFGRSFVIINSLEAAVELLEKRSMLYADRPQMTMLNEYCGWTWEFSFVPYNDEWKLARKIFNRKFGQSATVAHREEEVRCTRELLQDILRDQDGFFGHIRLAFGKLVMSVTYGIDVRSPDDKYITNAREALAGMNAAGNVGSYLVDVFPLLKYIPEWFPGAQWKKDARRWKRATLELVHGPFETVKLAMRDGSARTSALSSLLEEYGEKMSKEVEYAIMSACGTAYDAASETLYSTALSIVLAMILYPNVQSKAHAELDRVVGTDRFPEFNDQEDLPYIAAICKEALRWRTGVPLSIAHRVTEDDVYKGYFIPGGSTIVVNSWAILRDETRYPDPKRFCPERYLDAGGQLDPAAPEPDAAFGFGRRVCAGMYMAQDTVWMLAATLLWAFNIEHAVDKHGQPIELSGKYTSGLTRFPEPFKCSFTPRNKAIRDLMTADL